MRFRATGRFGLGASFGLAAAAVVTAFAAWPAAAFFLLAAFEASSAPTRVAGAAAAPPLLVAFEAAVLAGDVDFETAFVFSTALALAGALAFLAVSVATLLGLAVVDGAAAALAFDLDGVAAALALTVFFGAAAAPFDRDAVFAVAFGAALRSVRSAAVFAERSVVDVDLEAVGGLRRALVDLDLDEDVFDAVAVIGLGFRMADQTDRRNRDRPYRPGWLARMLGPSYALSS